jgi:enoyl-CoA hydratase/carnithine racemase
VTAPAPVLFEQEGHVALVTLNRPEQRNALVGDELFGSLEEICARIQGDLSVRCVILTGAGTAFSAGGSVKQMRDREGIFAGGPGEVRAGYHRGIQRIPRALWELEVPTIAAVNGPAIGAGCDLACMCDIRIASEAAVFAESFVKLGIVPGDGGAWLLPRVVGLSRACELAFTGETIDAHQALAHGLVSRVVAPDRLVGAARELAERIAVNPPQALRWTKRLIREGLDASLPTALEMAAAFQAMAHHTSDHREAVSAFFEKRAPVFRGC